MAKYDPTIIREYADRLYTRADFIVYRETFIGLLVGCAIGFVGSLELPLKMLTNAEPGDARLMVSVAGGVIGTLIGWAIGNDKALGLRLKAQMALCQAQIERNTRVGAHHS